MILSELAPFLVFVPGLPMLAFLVLVGLGRRMGRGGIAFWGCVGPILSFALAVRMASVLWGMPGDSERSIESVLYTWIGVGDLQIPFGLRLDGLSAVMALVVTGVGSLIHVYSVGYMAHDPNPHRYFAYLNLFTGTMLLLVLADNLALLFVGWEGVGLCSYLLIGFWYTKDENARAAQKAFLVNRIGDAAFLVGLFLAAKTFGTLDLVDLSDLAARGDRWIVLAIAALLFVGATGKSAQIPLYVWLPDAMAGPTPVSALIHAATMVTSGIYLVARLGGLYAAAPLAGEAIALVGAATALYAATIALSQRDLKKILAYSTISQLGYMFLGVGMGAYASAVFHLVTHAFFKALLFLAAGSVIHGLGGEQDIFRMGGLRRKMPLTFIAFVVGALALAGIPAFSGFFSKDAILAANLSLALQGGNWVAVATYAAALLGAFLTAVYIFRAVALVFLNEPRPGVVAHESKGTMAFSLAILAGLAAAGGVLGVHALAPSWGGAIRAALAPVVDLGGHPTHGEERANLALAVLAAVLGAAAGLYLFTRGRSRLEAALSRPFSRSLASASRDAYGIDGLYAWLVVSPVRRIADACLRWIDLGAIEGILAVLAQSATGVGDAARRLHGGRLRFYATGMLVGALAILGFLLYFFANRGG